MDINHITAISYLTLYMKQLCKNKGLLLTPMNQALGELWEFCGMPAAAWSNLHCTNESTILGKPGTCCALATEITALRKIEFWKSSRLFVK